METNVGDWLARGRRIEVGGEAVFVVDVPAAPGAAGALSAPLLVLHGFPTSSHDFVHVVDALAGSRRVVLFDFPGFGASAKADRAYSLFGQADVAEAVAREVGLDEVVLVSHDMGDSVAGEILARDLNGALGFGIERRVVLNGSIYLALANLTPGQQALLALPDETLPEGAAPNLEALEASLALTLAPGSRAPCAAEVAAMAVLVARDGGARLLPRLIRYIDERRVHERRWTGAIETHPAPLTVVWGDADSIAVFEMAQRLVAARDDADLVRLEGIGHYPTVEAPAAVAAALLGADPPY